MDPNETPEEKAPLVVETAAALPAASADDLAWAVVTMRAGETIIVNSR